MHIGFGNVDIGEPQPSVAALRMRLSKSALIFATALAFVLALSIPRAAFALDDADARLTVDRLDNGATVIVWEDHANPIITIDVWMKTGSLVETDDTWGIAHFFEHMFYRGTAARGPRANRDEIIDIGGMTSAGTWYDYTHFYNIVDSSHFDLGVDTLTDSLQNLTLTQESADSERSVISEEIKQRLDDPGIYTDEEMATTVFLNHRYGKRVIGTLDSITKFDRQDIVDYYGKYYAPENAIFVVSGDVKPGTAIDTIQAKISGWKNSNAKPSWDAPKSGYDGYAVRDDVVNFNVAIAGLGFRTGGYRHPDRYALEILEYLLLTSRSARLNALAGGDIGGIFGGLSQFRDGGLFTIYGIPAQGVGLASVAADIVSDVADYAMTGPTQSDVNDAIASLKLAIRFYQSGAAERASLLGEAAAYGNLDYYVNYSDNLGRVTADDVKRVLKTYFVEDNLSVVYFKPRTGAVSGDESALDAALARLPAPSGSVNFNKVLYDDKLTERTGKGAPGAQAAGAFKTAVGADGMKIVAYNQSGADLCSMGVFFPAGGANDPSGKEGLTQLTLSMLEYGGPSLTYDTVLKSIAGMGNAYGVGCDRDYSQVYITTTADRAGQALDLLKKLVSNPGFDENALANARGALVNYLSSAAEDITTVGMDNFKRYAFDGHAYSRPVNGSAATLDAITADDVKAHWQRVANPKGAVLIFVGDTAKAGFGGDLAAEVGTMLNGTGEPFSPVAPPDAATGAKGGYQVNLPRMQNLLIVGARTPGVLSNDGALSSDYGALMVLGSLLSIRSFREVVYEKGLAYRAVGAYQAWRAGGLLTLMLGYSPSQEGAVMAVVNDQISRVCITPVSETELDGVKGFITGYQTISLEQPQDKLMRFGQWEMTGAGFDFLPKFVAAVNAVTPADVQAEAQRYFAADKLLEVFVTSG